MADSIGMRNRINTLDDVFRINKVRRSDIILFEDENTKENMSTNADAVIKQITKAYNSVRDPLDWDNTYQPKYYLYWRRRNSGWVLDVVYYCYVGADLGSGHHFASRDDANDAAAKFDLVWQNYLP